MDDRHEQPAEPYREGFSATLRRLRMEAGLSREELAERSGFSASYLAKLEGGKEQERRFPSPKALAAIADALGSSPRELIDMAEEQGTAVQRVAPSEPRVPSSRPAAAMARRASRQTEGYGPAEGNLPGPAPWLFGLQLILEPHIGQGGPDLIGAIEQVARLLTAVPSAVPSRQTVQLLEQLLTADQPPERLGKLLGVALTYLRDTQEIEEMAGDEVELTRLLDIARTLMRGGDGITPQVSSAPTGRDHHVWLTALGLADDGSVWIDPRAAAHRAGRDEEDPKVRRLDDGRIQVDLSRLDNPALPPRDPARHKTRALMVTTLDLSVLPLTAYEATLIHIDWEPEVTIEVAPAPLGTSDGEFPASHRSIHIVTACNPAPHVLPPEENARRNERLLADIKAAGLAWRPALGRSAEPTKPWEEPSFALLDVERHSAIDLARAHEQAAIFEWTADHRAVVLCNRADEAHEEDVRPSGWRARWS